MSIPSYQHTITERFMRYVQIDTQSDPNATTHPTTEKQKNLSALLQQELIAMGISDAVTDEFGYVYASIPATTSKKVPVLCFCAHVDTAPDCSGTNVKPILHRNYSGAPLILPDDQEVIITTEQHPYLKSRIGDDIITASGKTLLGADDKAGVAIIMDLANYLISHPEIEHGLIRIVFTPDEEVGKGVAKIDMQQLGADFGYTLDGGERGHLEGESFSANSAKAIFKGISAHPGYAKGKMVSALKAAAHFVNLLPLESWCPEATEGDEGFVHPMHMDGVLEEASVQFIVRDFDTQKLQEHEDRLRKLLKETERAFPGIETSLTVQEQYRNMREVLDQYPEVMEYAAQAYKKAGVEPEIMKIRGGTDGSRLSFMGLPCPNIFTGEMGIHSKQEYVSVQDMEKACEILVHLTQIWTNESK